MRKILKPLAAFLCLIFCFGGTAFGATPEMEKAGENLRILNILKGYEDGSLRLDNAITRGEFCTMVMRMLGYDEIHYTDKAAPFWDVSPEHWARPFIADAAAYGLIAGDPDGRFRPDDTITYAETLVVVMRLLKWNPKDGLPYPENYIYVADTNRLSEGLSGTAAGKAATRGEIAILLENALAYKIG